MRPPCGSPSRPSFSGCGPFVEWHLSQDHAVTVLCPTNLNVATYMARMGVDRGLSDGTFIGLPSVSSSAGPDVLIPITQLHEFNEVDELGEQVFQLFLGHSDNEVAVFASAMHMAVSELCANAVEHGANSLGCYVAAQRYERPHRRTVLALGDLGVGIPKHMARRFDQLRGDRSALREAVKEGVTATGKSERGIGFTSVMEEAMASQMRYATLDIHSGEAQLQQFVSPGDSSPAVTTAKAPNKIGTWLTFEIGPLSSV
jgi:anti-sigma regulatory factor (Ser/Thr protein kinase)